MDQHLEVVHAMDDTGNCQSTRNVDAMVKELDEFEKNTQVWKDYVTLQGINTVQPSEHDTLERWCFNVGPASATLLQH